MSFVDSEEFFNFFVVDRMSVFVGLDFLYKLCVYFIFFLSFGKFCGGMWNFLLEVVFDCFFGWVGE